MNRKLHQLTMVIGFIAIVTMISTNQVWAQKGGKGGGGNNNPPPAGTIYYQGDGGLVTTVHSDGSGLQTLPGAYDGDPSFRLHAGKRWFTFFSGAPASTAYLFPDGRERYKVEVSDEHGARVLIVAESDLAVLSPPRWTPDDLSISFMAERWAFDPATGVHTEVVEAGLYTIDLQFDSAGSILSAVPGSQRFLADLGSVLPIDAQGLMAGLRVAGHAWAPLVQGELSAFVFCADEPTWSGDQLSAIWSMDLNAPPATALTLLNVNNFGSGWPEWSPDGTRICFDSWEGIRILNLFTGRQNLIKRRSTEYWGKPHWSPDGAHLLAYRADFTRSFNEHRIELYRFDATGGGKTLILANLIYADPLGWRE